jgi:hypothetical protein
VLSEKTLLPRIAIVTPLLFVIYCVFYYVLRVVSCYVYQPGCATFNKIFFCMPCCNRQKWGVSVSLLLLINPTSFLSDFVRFVVLVSISVLGELVTVLLFSSGWTMSNTYAHKFSLLLQLLCYIDMTRQAYTTPTLWRGRMYYMYCIPACVFAMYYLCIIWFEHWAEREGTQNH